MLNSPETKLTTPSPIGKEISSPLIEKKLVN